MSASVRLGLLLDRHLCRYGTSRLEFRGPSRPLNGRHIAFFGGSETMGPSLLHAYPDLIEEQLGEVCINLGQKNASIDVAMHDPLIGNTCRDAVLTVVSVTGAMNMSNRFYSVHPRRNDRFTRPSAAIQSLYPEVDFSQICFTRHLIGRLHDVSPSRFGRVREELQAAWSARMRTFLERIGPDVVLAWFAPHLPLSNKQLASRDPQLMQEPLFVTMEMLTALRPLVRNLVIVPLAPTSKPTELLEARAHRIAADALIAPITEAIHARSIKGNLRSSPLTLDFAAMKRLSAPVEGSTIVSPVVLSGTNLLGAEPIEKSRDVELPAGEQRTKLEYRDSRSIAIIPFTVANPDGETPEFASLLAEHITNAFHLRNGVEIRLPPAATDQRITSEDIERLKKGGLSHILVGHLAVMGHEVRLTAKLLDLGLGSFVWIQHFNRQLPQSLQAVADLGQEVAANVLSSIAEMHDSGA